MLQSVPVDVAPSASGVTVAYARDAHEPATVDVSFATGAFGERGRALGESRGALDVRGLVRAAGGRVAVRGLRGLGGARLVERRDGVRLRLGLRVGLRLRLRVRALRRLLLGIRERGMVLARLAGESQAFKATAVFDDGTSANVSFAATWQSTAPAVASIDATGVALAKTAGATDEYRAALRRMVDRVRKAMAL